MELLNLLGLLYVVRPLAAAVVPSRLIYAVKRLYHGRKKDCESRQENMPAAAEYHGGGKRSAEYVHR